MNIFVFICRLPGDYTIKFCYDLRKTLCRRHKKVDTQQQTYRLLKVSVNENFSTFLDFVFLDFWHEWVLNLILAKKEKSESAF